MRSLRRLVAPVVLALAMGSLAACAVYEPAPGPHYYSGGYYYGPSVYVGGGGYYHRHW
ncbi:MAG TPA: hypothetical protein VGG27_16480 [Magnetospirillaceae bacterium]|jgi:hypothetical protein